MSRASVGTAGVDDRGTVVRFATAASPGTVRLTEELHANRIFLNDIIQTGAGLTVTLPRATGTGNKYTIVNNAVQTLSTIFNVSSIDVMTGVNFALSTTTTNTDVCLTASTSDTITMNATTTGGLGGDWAEFVDMRQDASGTGVWLVRLFTSGSGTMATPFSAAVS